MNDKEDAQKWRWFFDIHGSLGIYPKSWNGKDRTAYQEGWNDCQMQFLACYDVVSTCYEEIGGDIANKIQKMLSDDILFMKIKMDIIPEIKFVVNCNDLFWWACADNEEIKIEEIKEFYNMCYDNEGNERKWGSTYWACRKRQMRPQHPIEEDMKKEGAWTQELELLPVRDFTG